MKKYIWILIFCFIYGSCATTSTSTTAATSLSFTITGMDFANTDKDRNILGSFGTTFTTSVLRYITPRITYNYNGFRAINMTLNIKIIRPDGRLMTGSSSQSGYSYNTTFNVQPNKRGERALLSGFGTSGGGSYTAGTYTCEIWSNGQLLRSARFTVTSGTTPSTTQRPSTAPNTAQNVAPNVAPNVTPSVSRIINFSYNGPVGSQARLTLDNRVLGTIAPGNRHQERFNNDGNYVFEVQILHSRIPSDNPLKGSLTVNLRGNTEINVDIVASLTPMGTVILQRFSERLR